MFEHTLWAKQFTYAREIDVWDFPGGPGVKNPSSNVGDMVLIPGRGIKLPHATGHLRLCSTTRKERLRTDATK